MERALFLKIFNNPESSWRIPKLILLPQDGANFNTSSCLPNWKKLINTWYKTMVTKFQVYRWSHWKDIHFSHSIVAIRPLTPLSLTRSISHILSSISIHEDNSWQNRTDYSPWYTIKIIDMFPKQYKQKQQKNHNIRRKCK